MKEACEILKREEAYLLDVQEKTEMILRDAPEGVLRVSSSHHIPQFYLYRDAEGTQNSKGIYLPSSQIELVKQLATKAYAGDVQKFVSRKLAGIRRFLGQYQEDDVDSVLRKQSEIRQGLISPVEPLWEDVLREWHEKPFQGKGFTEKDPLILTNSGLRVRSKSERSMADYFDAEGVLYKYECPIYLEGFGYVYPDFTFLVRKRRMEIYWEHLGKMDDVRYVNKAIRKIDAYEKNGIYVGKNLILTYETQEVPLNLQVVRQNTDRWLR